MEKNLLLEKALAKPTQERAWKFSLGKCLTEWVKSKKKYMEMPFTFHIYQSPVPAFTNKKPVYLIGFKRSMVSEKVFALVYYPNVGYVSTTLYSPKVWKEMIKERGSSLKIHGVKITIGEKGFEIEAQK